MMSLYFHTIAYYPTMLYIYEIYFITFHLLGLTTTRFSKGLKYTLNTSRITRKHLKSALHGAMCPRTRNTNWRNIDPHSY